MNFATNIAETYNYDAWGRRRNPETWTYNNVPEPQFTRVGYTGHEHWDELGLINMTGRMYDPRLARFLSPDPYVQMPDNTQNLNRYSYCLNNPLIYTDPSGEFIFTLLASVIPGAQPLLPFAIAADIGWMTGGYQGGVIANGTYDPTQWSWNKETWSSVGIGAAIGTAAGLASCGVGAYVGGIVSSAQIYGAFGGAIVGASVGATAGFINGTGMALLSGDDFGTALGSGGIQASIGLVTGAVIGGVVSGIQAHSKGGDFWNGKVGTQEVLTNGENVIPHEGESWRNNRQVRIDVPENSDVFEITVDVPRRVSLNGNYSYAQSGKSESLPMSFLNINNRTATLSFPYGNNSKGYAVLFGERPTYIYTKYWYHQLLFK